MPIPFQHYLPSKPYTRLFGREQLVNTITRELLRGHHYLVSIEGIMGLGKTALALEVAWLLADEYDRLPLDQRFGVIVFVSAKKQRFSANGTVALDPTFTTLRSVFEEIVRVLHVPIRLTDSDERNRDVIRVALNEAMSDKDGGRMLLVLDDLDEVHDRANVERYLLSDVDPLIRQCTVLVTMRHGGNFGCAFHPGALEDDDMRQLIQHVADSIGFRLRQETQQTLVDQVRGLPLGGQLSVPMVKQSGLQRAKLRLTSTTEDYGSDLLGNTFEFLRANQREAYDMLRALSFFDQRYGADPDAILAILGWGSARARTNEATLKTGADRYRSQIKPLRDLGLVYPNEAASPTSSPRPDTLGSQRRDVMLTTTQHFVEDELAQDRPWEEQARGRWIDWYLRFVAECGGKDWSDWGEHYSGLKEEWPNLQRVFAWCRQHNRYDDLKRFWLEDRVDTFATLYGLWTERLATMQWLAEEAERRGDWAALVAARSNAGWIASHQGRAEDAERWLIGAWMQRAQADLRVQCDLASNLAEFSIRQGAFQKAHEYLDMHVQLCELMSGTSIMAKERIRIELKRHYYRAIIYYMQNDLDTARNWFTVMKQKCNRIPNEGTRRPHYLHYERPGLYARNWLADIDIREGNLGHVGDLLDEIEQTAKYNGDVRRLAYVTRSRATLEARLADAALACFARNGDDKEQAIAGQHIVRATVFWQDARQRFEFLGMIEEANEVTGELTRLPPVPKIMT